MGIKESFLGEGAGKYDIMAYYVYGMKSMPDGEYMKILAEQGYVGLLLTISVFGCGLLKALRNFRYLYMEFFLLSMLFICMIGADPLTISDKHCFMYWLALGQVSKYK